MVMFSLPDVVAYDTPDIVIGISSLDDMGVVKASELVFPHRSVTPPACIVTFRGWFRASKLVFVLPLSVIVRMPSDISVKEFAANVTLPVPVELCSVIFVELWVAIFSESTSARTLVVIA